MIPNIALGNADDAPDDTTLANLVYWPFKPILLFGAEGNASEIVVFRAQIQYDVTFRGMRYDPDAIE